MLMGSLANAVVALISKFFYECVRVHVVGAAVIKLAAVVGF